MSNPQITRMATIDRRDDGFYVRVSVSSATTMQSGHIKRRPLSTPTEFGPFPDNESAIEAQQAFINFGTRPVIPPQ